LAIGFEPNVGQAPSWVRFLAHTSGATILFGAHGITLITGDSRGLAPQSRGSCAITARCRAARAAPAVIGIDLLGARTQPRLKATDRLPGTVNYFLGNDPRHWHTGIPTFARLVYRAIYPGIDLAFEGRAGALEYDFVVRPGGNPADLRLGINGAAVRLDGVGDLVMTARGGAALLRSPLGYQVEGPGRQAVAARYVLGAQGRIAVALARYDRRRTLELDPAVDFATYLGGTGDLQGSGIAVDRAGHAYVVGTATTIDFPTRSLAPGRVRHGRDSYGQPLRHAVVAELNTAGTALLSASYVGGSADDYGTAIALDGAGDAYITGETGSPDFPVTPHALQRRYGAQDRGDLVYLPPGNAFVVKVAPGGTRLLYGSYLGGSSPDTGTGIAVDRAGNVFVAGYTISTDFPTTPGAVQRRNGGLWDAFVASLNPQGTALRYATYLGGSGRDFAYGIAVDQAGHAYVVGEADANSTDFPTTRGAVQAISRAVCCPGGDAFVAKLSLDGRRLLYATHLGGLQAEGQAIAVDGAGNAYVTGETGGDFPTTPGAYQIARGGGFVAKVDPSGSQLLYATQMSDPGEGIAVDARGEAMVTGTTDCTTFAVTVAAAQPVCGGDGDAFVGRFSADGRHLLYATFLGGSGTDDSAAIALDGAGTAYVTGSTTSRDFPTITPAVQLRSRNAAAGSDVRDGFVVKLYLADRTANAGHLQLPVVSRILTASRAQFTHWLGSRDTPPRSDSFAAGTPDIAYYLQYSYPGRNGPVLSSSFAPIQAVVYDEHGSIVASDVVHAPAFPSGTFATLLALAYPLTPADPLGAATYWASPLPVGNYRLAVVAAGHALASTRFTIRPGPAIMALYTSTPDAMTSWRADRQVPPQLTTFSGGASEIAYYLAYAGARGARLRFHTLIRDGHGAVVATGIAHTLRGEAGDFMARFAFQPSLPSGSYSLDLVVGGATVARTRFNVGSPLQIVDFYTTSRGAYNAWSGSPSTLPQAQADFPAATRQIAYFVAFSGAVPGRQRFHAVIYDDTGAVLATGMAHTFRHVDGAFMTFFTYRPAIPQGRYRLDLMVDGIAVAGTEFTVAGDGQWSRL
jgi:hypothetical protein